MPFIMSLKKDIENAGNVSALDRKLLFDEREVLELIKPALAATVYKCQGIEIVEVDPNEVDLPVPAQGAIPGQPGVDFVNL